MTPPSSRWLAFLVILTLALALPAAAAPQPQGLRRPPLPRPRRRDSLLLPGRHRLGALPPPGPRGGHPLPGRPGLEGLHRDPGRGPGGARRAQHPEPLRLHPADRQRPLAARREARPRQRLLGPRRLDRGRRQRARPDHWPAAHLGRQVEPQVGRRGRWSSPRRTPSTTASGWGTATTRRTSSGSWAGTGPSRATSTPRSSGRWRGASAAADGGAHLMTFHPIGRAGLRPVLPRRRVARLQHAPERPRHHVHRGATRGRWRTTSAPRPSPSSTASRSTRTTRCPSSRTRTATRSRPTCAGRCTGTSSRGPSVTPTAITRSGRCGSRDATRSTSRSCPGTRRSTSRVRGRCSTGGGFSSRGRSGNRIPDDSVIVTDEIATAVPGAGRYRLKATRDSGGAWAMVYTPSGRAFSVDLEKLSGGEGEGVVVRPPGRVGGGDRGVCAERGRGSSCRRRPGRCSTGCWCWMMRRRGTRRRGRGGSRGGEGGDEGAGRGRRQGARTGTRERGESGSERTGAVPQG